MVRHGRLPVNIDGLRDRASVLENNVESMASQMEDVKQMVNANEAKIAQLEQIYKSEEMPAWARIFLEGLEGISELRDSVQDLRNLVKDLDSRISKLEGQADTESTEIQLENKGTVKARIRAIEQQKGKKNDVWIEED